MHELGYLTLMVALVVSVFSGAASVVGYRRRMPRLEQAGYVAAFATTALVTVSAFAMIYLFTAQDFSVKYVQHYSDRTMPLAYVISAFWGGQDGSLLFWAWLLSLYSAAALWWNRKQTRLVPYATAVLMSNVAFFMLLLLFPANPFETFIGSAPSDGQGMNPLLQNPYMAIHPPMLYLGYIGMVIPFAFGVAAMASGKLDETWLRLSRRWTLTAWFFLGFGLILGMLWAYEELGWGGYWAWDPVENAGFLPWLSCTAFLHSIMIQERRGMFKNWNMVLVIHSFAFVLLGTFLTRSGVVQSVHAFAQSSVGPYFTTFLSGSLLLSFGLMFYRRKELESPIKIESVFSREFSFLLNNWILLGMAYFVLIATIFPSISDAFMGEKITVGPPFFNKWMVPLGLILLFLTGVGPLIAWRKASGDSLKKQFTWPALGAVATGSLSVALGATEAGGVAAIVNFALCGLVTTTIIQEFWRGTRVRMRNTGEGAVDALVGLMSRAKRRYGGYVIHFGIVLMFFGWAGEAYKQETDVSITRGQTAPIGRYLVRFDDLRVGSTTHRDEHTAVISVLDQSGKLLAEKHPAKWFYRKSQQPTTEVSIKSGIIEDLYLIFAGFDESTGHVMLRLIVNPLVIWVWIGSAFLILGMVIVMWPDRHRKKHLGSSSTA
ncbi:MAG: heme lyase CcmF/NrfE family subunit [Deltaproteobacteria bacterium]|nr:heme lyase CcmF/NrfE family subunit [Deltaproteobacteria bacterium]